MQTMFIKILFVLTVFGRFSFIASQEESTTVDYGEVNDAFENFLLEALTTNYSTWLSRRDPLPVIPQSIRLEGETVDFLEIKNQAMSGHSKSTSDQFFIYPFLSINQFSVGRNVLNDGDFLTFEGNYNATGFIRLYDPDQRDVNFTGQGRWTLKSNEVVENLAYGNFSLDSNGFVDVSLSNKVWVFRNQWSDINFEGLKIENGGSENDEEELKIEAMKILADLYGNFLRGPFLPELQEYNPTRKLLMVHIQELLKTKTLEDIISDYEPPSTPPKYTQTTDAPSRSTSLMVGNVLWMLFMIRLCVY